jgi:hypothetical protein
MKWLFRGSAIVVILFFSCVGSFALTFVFRQIESQNTYCSKNSLVYQAMENRREDWINRFATSTSRIIHNDMLLTIGNRSIYAEAYWDEQSNLPALMYVIVGSDIDGLRGSDGFIYLFPNRSIPAYWFENYWITQLDEDIYCYTIRGF